MDATTYDIWAMRINEAIRDRNGGGLEDFNILGWWRVLRGNGAGGQGFLS